MKRVYPTEIKFKIFFIIFWNSKWIFSHLLKACPNLLNLVLDYLYFSNQIDTCKTFENTEKRKFLYNYQKWLVVEITLSHDIAGKMP